MWGVERKLDYSGIVILRNIDKYIWILKKRKEIYTVNSDCCRDLEVFFVFYLCMCNYNCKIYKNNYIIF